MTTGITHTIESTRFGTIEVAADAVIEFPRGLIGLGGTRYALIPASDDGTFMWLQSAEDPALAIPVCNPFAFFAHYEVRLSDEATAALGMDDAASAAVWVTVRAAEKPEDFRANLKAPILIAGSRAAQIINEFPDAPVQATLFEPGAPAGQAA